MGGALESVAALGWRPGAIIDIGVAMGTEGLYSVWDVPILLIDPAPANRVYMEQIQKTHSKAQIWNVAASNKTGVAKGSYFPAMAQVALTARKSKPGWERRSFQTMTCDDIVEQAGVEPPFLFKLDTDWHEGEILQGAEATLKRTEFCIIECKVFNGIKKGFTHQHLMDVMHARGFALYDVVGLGYNDKERTILRSIDFAFAPEGSNLFQAGFSRARKASKVYTDRRPAQREAAKQNNDFF